MQIIAGKFHVGCHRMSLNWVILSYVLHYICHSITVCDSMLFTPHELVEVAWQLVGMVTFHTFKLCLNSVPVAFNVLRVNSCDGIHKVV